MAGPGPAYDDWSLWSTSARLVVTEARPVWRTVTVAAPTCLLANAASTASVVLGEDAPAWLAERHLDARLVGADGRVVRVGGWPTPGDRVHAA